MPFVTFYGSRACDRAARQNFIREACKEGQLPPHPPPRTHTSSHTPQRTSCRCAALLARHRPQHSFSAHHRAFSNWASQSKAGQATPSPGTQIPAALQQLGGALYLCRQHRSCPARAKAPGSSWTARALSLLPAPLLLPVQVAQVCHGVCYVGLPLALKLLVDGCLPVGDHDALKNVL